MTVEIGDRVRVKPEYDEAMMILGRPSPAGTIDHMQGEMAVVNLDDGKAVPYPPEQLEPVSDELEGGAANDG